MRNLTKIILSVHGKAKIQNQTIQYALLTPTICFLSTNILSSVTNWIDSLEQQIKAKF